MKAIKKPLRSYRSTSIADADHDDLYGPHKGQFLITCFFL